MKTLPAMPGAAALARAALTALAALHEPTLRAAETPTPQPEAKPPFAASLATGVSFRSDKADCQRIYDAAGQRLKENIVRFIVLGRELVVGMTLAL